MEFKSLRQLLAKTTTSTRKRVAQVSPNDATNVVPVTKVEPTSGQNAQKYIKFIESRSLKYGRNETRFLVLPSKADWIINYESYEPLWRSNDYGYDNVLNDLESGTREPVTCHLPKTAEIIFVQSFQGLGRGPHHRPPPEKTMGIKNQISITGQHSFFETRIG